SGTPADLGQPDYERLKETLTKIRHVNPDVRFAYIMKKEQNTLVLLADSESPDSPDYSPPGDVYYEASPDELAQFATGEPFVTGPTEDRWGVWYTAYSPIYASGAHIASLGLDINAQDWRSEIWFARGAIALTSALLAAIVLVILVYSRRLTHMMQWLERTHEELRQSREYLAEAERLAKLGRFSWNVLTGSMSWNGELYKIFDLPTDEVVTIDTIHAHVIDEDTRKFKRMIDEAIHASADTFTIDFRIAADKGHEKHLYAICSIKRSPKGEPIRVIGALQDITEQSRLRKAIVNTL
ncbi:MAG TPA: PAS domain-containing protein, partial [Blastocatellia bacterium]|nr:PAS domain-containing protein [Blastocatellia bacterium]